MGPPEVALLARQGPESRPPSRQDLRPDVRQDNYRPDSRPDTRRIQFEPPALMRGPLPDRSIPASGSIRMSDDDRHEFFRIQQQIQALVSKVSLRSSRLSKLLLRQRLFSIPTFSLTTTTLSTSWNGNLPFSGLGGGNYSVMIPRPSSGSGGVFRHIWLDPETVCYLDYYNPSRACSAGPVPI